MPTNGSNAPNNAELERLRGIARQMRRDIVLMTSEANSGHPGGSLSAVEILAALYFHFLKHDPENPSWPDRDRFIMSKGHASPVIYSALARSGYFPVEELMTYRKLNSRLQGHPKHETPGVEVSSGSLGQGLSFGIGCALSARLDNKLYRTYVLLGDGECDEGQVWEAAMSAAHYKVDNLTAYVDRNGIQNDRFTSQVMELEPLSDKWRAFGWQVFEIDGHDLAQVIDATNQANAVRGKPAVIIARTVKGKGVSFMENNPDFHGRAANKEELPVALKELENG
ncbi:MAG: transketolase [Dehalococcoidia bacterium]|nr:transketolase [Dehalococcoidia bacterium]